MTKDEQRAQPDSMVKLVNDVYPVHTPKAKASKTKQAKPPKSLDRVKGGARRTPLSEKEFDGLDFTVPVAQRVTAPDFARTRRAAPPRNDPESANRP